MTDFWSDTRRLYVPQTPLLNLNNAAVSPPSIAVQDEVVRAYRFANQNPDFNMWSGLDTALPETKRGLAELADCDPDEIALLRNASEGLSVAIFGVPLARNAEVVVSAWDYPSALYGWQQRAQREGVRVVTAAFGHMDDDDTIVEAYRRAITERTKVIHLTHILHWTGRVLPVERICAMARSAGVATIVDAAQTFAQMPVSFRRLECDYFVTSLHKWLGAPIGNGMLIVRRSAIADTFPLMAPFEPDATTIDKFDHWNLGTYNSALQTGIAPAIAIHREIGVERIHARLNALSRYWIEAARDIKGLELLTPVDDRLGAISLFRVAGCNSRAIETTLRERHRIHVKYRKVGDLEGLRVSPHFTTSEDDLQTFVTALRAVVGEM